MTYSNAALPRKRVGASALYLDSNDSVLLVKPTYRDDWLTPGGTVDENESPLEGCSREVLEELGNPFPVTRLLCIEYRSAHGTKVENLQFVFWGGSLTTEQVAAVRVPAGEIAGFEFVRPTALDHYLNTRLAARVRLALDAASSGRLVYLEDGVQRG